MSAQVTRPPGEPMRAYDEVKPNPDPSTLTTSQLLREVTMLREVIDVRFEGNDKAIVLLQKSLDTFPQLRHEGLEQLQNLQDEKFKSIEVRFGEQQKLYEEKFRSIEAKFSDLALTTERTARDGKVAVDAAFSAAKEAVGEQNKSNTLAIAKSEAAFAKQVDGISALIDTKSKATDDKIDDMKARLAAIEGQKKGADNTWGYIVAAVSALVALVSVGFLIANNVGGP